MRPLYLINFLLSSSAAFGQVLPDTVTKIEVSPTFSATPGKTYVDSVEMDMSKTYLDPDNIQEVRSFKGKDSKIFSEAKGVTLLTRRKQNPFISLSDIRFTNIHSVDTSLPTAFVIDGILMDTTAVRVEATAIKSIDIIKASANQELFHDTRKNVILLTTKSKARKKNGY